MSNEKKKLNTDEEIRELISRDKSMPKAKENEWSKIYASLSGSSEQIAKGKLWSFLSGGAFAFVVIGFLIFPRFDTPRRSGLSLNSSQEKQLVEYLFEEVGPSELSEEEREILPGL